MGIRGRRGSPARAAKHAGIGDEAEFRRELGRALEEWRNRPIDWDAVARQQREQSTRMAVMPAYLDRQVPPSPGEGQSP